MVVVGAAVVDSGIITETVAVSARNSDIAVKCFPDGLIDTFFYFERLYYCAKIFFACYVVRAKDC